MRADRPFDAVCFDCDSTLSRIEGIDELAHRAGLKSYIAPLTAAAMDGTLTLDAVYAKRLSLVRPDRAALAWLGERYVEEMVSGAKETVEVVHRLGKAVYIVSGGLLPAIAQLAQALKIPRDRTFAVDVLFHSDGTYLDFNRQSPLVGPDGKAVVCRSLATRHNAIAMVSEAVVNGSDVFIPGPDLTAVLDALLSVTERSSAGV